MDHTTMIAWFRSFRGASAKWRRRSHTERMLLLEAFTLLSIARLLVLTIPFKWLAATLGKHMKESGEKINVVDLRCARMIGQAVCSVANYTPWRSVCLPQAVAAQWMLKRRRIAGTLYLGVAKNDAKPEQLTAHAWLRCGDLILTGVAGHRQFTVVATFS